MKQKFKHLQSLITVGLCVFVVMALTGCSADDPEDSQLIGGEWINTDGDIYYQFSSDGIGRYICLADEPGYDPAHPESVVKNPVDPHYFDYIVEGDVLTMKEYANNQNKDDYTIYVCQIVVSKDVLQMKQLRWSDNGIDWYDSNDDWETFNRWTARK